MTSLCAYMNVKSHIVCDTIRKTSVYDTLEADDLNPYNV